MAKTHVSCLVSRFFADCPDFISCPNSDQLSILEVDGIELTFGRRTILQDVYLRCETGAATGLIGRNGSGKSCLLKIIFGSLRGSFHSVRVDGRYVVRAHEESDLLAFLPQNGFAMNYLTGTGLASIFRLNSDAIDYLRSIDSVDRHFDQKIGELSAGLKKLIEVLIVLHMPRKFILLDEPFSFLSPILVEEVIRAIGRQAGHKGILLTDHLYRHVLEVCDRHYLLTNGNLRTVTDLAELKRYGYLSE